jgi:hypothetical protein
VTAVHALASWSRDDTGPLPERVEHLRQLGHITEFGAEELLALLRPPGRRKHLYRVTATWRYAALPDGSRPADTSRVWHYQSKAAAEHRAAVLREGLPYRPDGHPEGPGQPEVPPAAVVTVERSEPVVWLGASA